MSMRKVDRVLGCKNKTVAAYLVRTPDPTVIFFQVLKITEILFRDFPLVHVSDEFFLKRAKVFHQK